MSKSGFIKMLDRASVGPPPQGWIRHRDRLDELSQIGSDQTRVRNFLLMTYTAIEEKRWARRIMRRLAGNSSQAVFKINNPPGLGKTHFLIMLGLLAISPELLAKWDKIAFYPELPTSVRVAAVEGSGGQFDWWAAISSQLRTSPSEGSVPGASRVPKVADWSELIGSNGPVLILLEDVSPEDDRALNPLYKALRKTTQSCVVLTRPVKAT